MFSRLLPAVLTAAGALGAGFAAAEEAGHLHHHHHQHAPVHCAPCERHLRHTEVKIYETQELVTVPEINIKEIVTKVPVKGVEVKYKEEKRSITIMVEKEREEERLVTSTTCIPETTIDPCTGCSITTYKHVPVCKTVKIKVWDVVPETKEYTVQVPVLECVDREIQVLQLTATATSAAATCTKLNAAITNTDVTIPAAPCPAIGCLPAIECKANCSGCSGGACHHGHK